ncbi:MAG: ThuA domain-containing protein [Verrucomicrobium sp.]
MPLAQAELTEQQAKVPLEVDSPDPALAKIVLIAGTPSNKPGQHEYFAGCALMMQWLKEQPGVWPVMVAEGWPKNEAVLTGAKAVLCYMDGADKLAVLEPARWEKLRGLMKQKAGLVMLHQAVEVPPAQAEEFKTWLGAVWQKDTGSRGHWDMTFDQIPAHPTLNGVKPFAAAKDGWLFNLHFADKGVTPLLTGAVPDKSRSTADAKAHAGRDEVIAWAYERAEGGRSIGFTGCDLHSSWGIESQRRFMVNALLWSAGLEVPKEGAKTTWDGGEARLLENWDRKVFAAKQPVKSEK